jgi:hypothetical protein
VDAFQPWVPAFEAGFQAQMADWRLDGNPRSARRLTVYENGPWPTPADRLLFILVSLKTAALQGVHGRLFGMVQGKANQGLHILLPALLAALRTVGDAPARSLTDLAQRVGVTATEAAGLVVPSATARSPADPSAEAPNAAPVPLVAMTAPHGASSAPKTLLNSRTVRAARKHALR